MRRNFPSPELTRGAGQARSIELGAVGVKVALLQSNVVGEEAAFDKRVVGINVGQALVEAVVVVGRNPGVGVKQE